MTEIEAKFLIEPDFPRQTLIDALHALPVELEQVSVVDVIAIVDRYFDTPDWQLLRQGWAFRWRDVSGNRQIALKSFGSAKGNIHRREEIEQDVPTFPDQGQPLPAGAVANRLKDVRQKNLTELFCIINQRQKFQIRTSAGALIELALDHVTLGSRESAEQSSAEKFEFAELELELIEGSEGMLQQIADTIEQQFRLVPSRLSKFERSVRHLGLCSPKSISKEVQRLEEYRALAALSAQSLKKNDATVKLAHRCCLKHFESMLAEEPIAWEGIEIEGVHQMRVATRRIRAALSAFKFLVQPDAREVFSREFKWLARVLGDVRDMDVCLENLRGYVMEIPADDANCLEAYRLHLAEQRKRARRELIACLSGVRYRRLVSDFSEYLKLGLSAESPSSHEFDSIRESAVRLIGKQYKRVLRQGRSITRQSPDQELHALRIECKRLRYRFEFFRSTYRSSLNPFIKSLKTLQNVLGEFQDAQVATQQLTEHAQCVPMESGNRGQLLALGQLIDSQRRHAWDRRKRFHKTWKRFDRRHARKRMLKLLR